MSLCIYAILNNSLNSIKSDQGKVKTSKKLLRLGKSMDSVEDRQRSSIE